MTELCAYLVVLAMNKKKICVVTGSRSDYGLIYWTLKKFNHSKYVELNIIVTGMHLQKEYGYTLNEIEKDGFKIYKKINIHNKKKSQTHVSDSISSGIKKFTNTFLNNKFDLLLLVGDRFETFAAAIAATLSHTPIAHIHGGEVTVGAFDESFRHSISKMSHIHFTSTQIYKNRLIQMGERPTKIFNIGAPGIENIYKLKLLDKKKIEKKLNFKFSKKNLIITYHPVTLDNKKAKLQFQSILKSLDKLNDTFLIFTKSNSDPEGNLINEMIDSYVSLNSHKSISFFSLGNLNYLSVLKIVDGIVGNSSSGLIEAPSLKKGTINIGDRQLGRVFAKNVINCSYNTKKIDNALKKLFSLKFKNQLKKIINPYGNGIVSDKILKIILKTELKNIIKKKFYDIKKIK